MHVSVHHCFLVMLHCVCLQCFEWCLLCLLQTLDCEECNYCDCNYYDCKYCGYYERGHYNCEDYLIDNIYNKGKWCYLGHKCPIVFLCIVDAFVELHL